MQSTEAKGGGVAAFAVDILKGRVLWAMLLRVGLISVLLGTTLALNYKTAEAFSAQSPRFLLALIAATYLCTIVYALWYRSGRALVALVRIQLLLDAVLWGCLAYVTGGIASGFTFLFHLWVIVAAVVVGGRAAFHFAATAAIVLIALTVLLETGALLPLRDQAAADLAAKDVAYFLGINIVSLFLVASLVNSLVARLEKTGRGLEVERAERADLAQLHSDVVQSLTVGIATTGPNGEMVMLNPAGCGILGATEAEVLGRKLESWLPDVKITIGRGEAARLRGYGTCSRMDGARVPVEYFIAPLKSADGAHRGYIVVFSDLTEVRRLEAALERSRRLAALGELAASLAHEIRNPLGAVSGSVQMLTAQPDLGEEQRVLFGIISRELKRMERLVGDVLDYARPRSQQQQQQRNSADVGKLLREILQVARLSEEIADRQTDLSVEEGLFACVDIGQIRQVLWNLLRNAAQATKPGDTIHVSARGEPDAIVIEVADSGAGISDEDRDKVFDPFFTTRERGLGLGLAVCHRIITEHRGEIRAEARAEGGTVFRITLARVEHHG